MEWNSMHALLEPPKGFEQFHTMKAVFPGCRWVVKFKSFQEFRKGVYGGWELYLHHYRPNPKYEGWLEQVENIERKKAAARGEKYYSYFSNIMVKGGDQAKTVGDIARDVKPDVKDYLKGRVPILQKAVSEFAEGFYETMSGKTNIWGVSIASIKGADHDDNPAIVYMVHAQDLKNKNSSPNQNLPN